MSPPRLALLVVPALLSPILLAPNVASAANTRVCISVQQKSWNKPASSTPPADAKAVTEVKPGPEAKPAPEAASVPPEAAPGPAPAAPPSQRRGGS